jgi:hypothetical protein
VCVSIGCAAGSTAEPAGEAVVLEGPVRISSSAEMEALAVHASFRIEGELIVEFTQLPDLRGLAGLKPLSGSLIIRNNPRLESLAGLDGLRELTGDLRLENNPHLADLSGLAGLGNVAGNVIVVDCPALASVAGLSSLEVVTGDLELSALAVKAIELPALLRVGGSLQITNNSRLASLDGLSSLEAVGVLGGTVAIRDNPALPEAQRRSLLDRARP